MAEGVSDATLQHKMMKMKCPVNTTLSSVLLSSLAPEILMIHIGGETMAS